MVNAVVEIKILFNIITSNVLIYNTHRICIEIVRVAVILIYWMWFGFMVVIFRWLYGFRSVVFGRFTAIKLLSRIELFKDCSWWLKINWFLILKVFPSSRWARMTISLRKYRVVKSQTVTWPFQQRNILILKIWRSLYCSSRFGNNIIAVKPSQQC